MKTERKEAEAMGKRAGQGMPSLPGIPSPGSTKTKSGVDAIEEMVGALTDPIIVFPAGGWEQDLPERLKNELPLRRLIHVHQCLNGKAEWDEATDIEALLYIYPASLAAPMSHDWAQIYLYLGTRVMGDQFPEDLGVETLSDHEMGELRDLKRWIRKKKVEARRERRHGRKAREKEARAELEPAKYEQMRLL
ncbi:MAG: hypothetical protein ACE5IA_06765 [Dehalococcoidia bacterium]